MFRGDTAVASGGTTSPGTLHVAVVIPCSSRTGPPTASSVSEPLAIRVTVRALEPPTVGVL